MITCRELVDFLLDYVSGELSQEHKDLVEKHLTGCPPCFTYLETYQMTIKLTRQLPCQPLPPQLAQRLRRALEEIRGENQGPCGPRQT
jgi:anti-sigma factor RsiW